MAIRNSAKAIIIHNNQILLNKCFDEHHGFYYSLPGGGQNMYETMEEAIVRECLEETGYRVIPLRFAALAEEICDDPQLQEEHPEYAHKIYHIFLCSIADHNRIHPREADIMQQDSVWIPIHQISTVDILPKNLSANLMNLINESAPLFLGSENIPYNHG